MLPIENGMLWVEESHWVEEPIYTLEDDNKPFWLRKIQSNYVGRVYKQKRFINRREYDPAIHRIL